ncbi:transcription antitermination factor NusB [Pararhodobacter aggregans]|uniref:Transcription antitermination protein NusB n=1 Tax=Pararhodobacter aggregans TaxID=404875 RepID=A0A2T7UND4_9RHOB|nr:transcription antitermination factor NusB [Pararhodobacter aggregans]PTX02536.1 NusB antitermination factor [Pararhodobacter aggregans]PVE46138.1 transcription antitermination factor NusB [Pararhodobacter aggregans]
MTTAKDQRAQEKRALRSAARFYAVQALFQMESSGQTVDKIRAEFENYRIGAEGEDETWVEADVSLFRTLVDKAVDQQGTIDQLTDRALVAKWPIARIDPTLRALFRAAGAELVETETPPRVIITEFVQIAQAFFPEGKESKFVNAVLDHMAREVRPEAF